MRFFLIRLLLPILLLSFSAAVIGYYWLFSPLQPEQAVHFLIKPGTSLNQVANELQKNGVLKSSLSLKLLARAQQQGGQIHTGTYLFEQPATPQMVLQRLTSGDVEKASLTVPEGFTLAEICQRVADLGYGDRDKLLQLASDPQFISRLKLSGASLEGYLFPETYLFTPGIGEAHILTMMVDQFRNHIDPALLSKAKQQQLDLHQLVTLASIIEKETGKVEEMPLISSVFHNRLRRGIPLQTDPTVIYGIRDFDGNLTRKHLKTPTPYNTYTIRGLPPGPIANPGLAALRAAAQPASSNLLYFVSRGDGSHQFSATLSEHNRAVRRYQLKRRH